MADPQDESRELFKPHLPTRSADPGVAFYRAAYLMTWVLKLSRSSSSPSRFPLAWVRQIIEAQIRMTDGDWLSMVKQVQYRISAGPSGGLWGPHRLLSDLMTRGAAAAAPDLFNQTFDDLFSVELTGDLQETLGALAYYVADALGDPSTVPRAGEFRNAIEPLSFPDPADLGPLLCEAEFRSLDGHWTKVDEASRRTLIPASRIHQWIRDGQVAHDIKAGAREICLGELAAKTGLEVLLPPLAFCDEGPERIEVEGRKLRLYDFPPPCIPTAPEILGFAVWSQMAPPSGYWRGPQSGGASDRMRFWIEAWGSRRFETRVKIHLLGEQEVRDTGGDLLMHRTDVLLLADRE